MTNEGQKVVIGPLRGHDATRSLVKGHENATTTRLNKHTTVALCSLWETVQGERTKVNDK